MGWDDGAGGPFRTRGPFRDHIVQAPHFMRGDIVVWRQAVTCARLHRLRKSRAQKGGGFGQLDYQPRLLAAFGGVTSCQVLSAAPPSEQTQVVNKKNQLTEY